MPRAKPVPVGAPNEPLWLLKSLPYGDYRMTNWWRRRRDAYRDKCVRQWGGKGCELCRLAEHPDLPVRYHVHHITYKRLGQEHDDDLRLLCSPCHNLVHRPDSNAAQHWAALERNADSGLALRAQALDPHVDSFYPHELASEAV